MWWIGATESTVAATVESRARAMLTPAVGQLANIFQIVSLDLQLTVSQLNVF